MCNRGRQEQTCRVLSAKHQRWVHEVPLHTGWSVAGGAGTVDTPVRKLWEKNSSKLMRSTGFLRNKPRRSSLQGVDSCMYTQLIADEAQT